MSTPGNELIETSGSHELVAQEAIAACANCRMPLTGQYCSHCGQRVEHHVHSLTEFLGEAAEVITHADSRVWRTFVPLLFRPGFLTQQYLAGRRASYLPPFRLYIVLSVVFFLMASFATHSTRMTVADPAKAQQAATTATAELQKEIDASTDPEEQAILRKQLAGISALNTRFSNFTNGGDCLTKWSSQSMPEWLRVRMIRGCQKIVADNGEELRENMIHNAGRAMFVFLPLIAALMKLLYWHPRRYYVEHLLLLLHNHAFIFVSVSILLALQMVVHSDEIMGWVSTALWLYIVWYLYRSMRRVYAQSRTRTLLKFAVLSAVYFFCALITFSVSTVYSAFTL